ncbi:MAG: hypothetical protein H0V07_07015 [Propionibacteriales bacterium]|nr:hypothetical protein [Propionibacteriales bacterium]
MITDLSGEPACWSWEVPPLPQRNGLYTIRAWQRERCAICGEVRPDGPPNENEHRRRGLFEDHDHVTGSTRGFLCPRCNTAEGRSPAPVFERYRERPPSLILGLLVRKGSGIHPEEREARIAFACALDDLHYRAEMSRRHPRTYVPEPLTALAVALERVNLTWDEWFGPPPPPPEAGRAAWRAVADILTVQP